MALLIIGNKNYSSWSLRPWVLMKMLDVPFEERVEPFDGPDNYERFRRFSPNGKVPCLVEDEITVWDSLAVIERIAEIEPKVWPRNLAPRSFARSVVCEIHSGFSALRTSCPMICNTRFKIQAVASELGRDLDRLDELLLEGLSKFGGPFLTGPEFTAVDAFLCPIAVRVDGFQLRLSPLSLSYCARLLELEPMRRWILEANDEPWIDEHEEAAARDNAVEVSRD